ncbi:hypothetical protein [Sagittula sp. S175]|uniref:hypothetical protein n=1 Tax=Sagittula sp. S175 TaxID=3415129 RepID=UPI003C7BF2D2
MTNAFPGFLSFDVLQFLAVLGAVLILCAYAAHSLRPRGRASVGSFLCHVLGGLCLIPPAFGLLSPVAAIVPLAWVGLSLTALVLRGGLRRPGAIPPAQIPWAALAREARSGPQADVAQPCPRGPARIAA